MYDTMDTSISSEAQRQGVTTIQRQSSTRDAKSKSKEKEREKERERGRERERERERDKNIRNVTVTKTGDCSPGSNVCSSEQSHMYRRNKRNYASGSSVSPSASVSLSQQITIPGFVNDLNDMEKKEFELYMVQIINYNINQYRQHLGEWVSKMKDRQQKDQQQIQQLQHRNDNLHDQYSLVYSHYKFYRTTYRQLCREYHLQPLRVGDVLSSPTRATTTVTATTTTAIANAAPPITSIPITSTTAAAGGNGAIAVTPTAITVTPPTATTKKSVKHEHNSSPSKRHAINAATNTGANTNSRGTANDNNSNNSSNNNNNNNKLAQIEENMYDSDGSSQGSHYKRSRMKNTNMYHVHTTVTKSDHVNHQHHTHRVHNNVAITKITETQEFNEVMTTQHRKAGESASHRLQSRANPKHGDVRSSHGHSSNGSNNGNSDGSGDDTTEAPMAMVNSSDRPRRRRRKLVDADNKATGTTADPPSADLVPWLLHRNPLPTICNSTSETLFQKISGKQGKGRGCKNPFSTLQINKDKHEIKQYQRIAKSAKALPEIPAARSQSISYQNEINDGLLMDSHRYDKANAAVSENKKIKRHDIHETKQPHAHHANYSNGRNGRYDDNDDDDDSDAHDHGHGRDHDHDRGRYGHGNDIDYNGRSCHDTDDDRRLSLKWYDNRQWTAAMGFEDLLDEDQEGPEDPEEHTRIIAFLESLPAKTPRDTIRWLEETPQNEPSPNHKGDKSTNSNETSRDNNNNNNKEAMKCLDVTNKNGHSCDGNECLHRKRRESCTSSKNLGGDVYSQSSKHCAYTHNRSTRSIVEIPPGLSSKSVQSSRRPSSEMSELSDNLPSNDANNRKNTNAKLSINMLVEVSLNRWWKKLNTNAKKMIQAEKEKPEVSFATCSKKKHICIYTFCINQ
ncbi:SNF2-related domain-containing protein [Reticulomyxa filosa]|uniref:SNF2-related domain-containing protein n=1 Tax=Reticulomyxa filosa TaxID=46433 RepID=X6M3S9_RETFI|nr:SNF2-related domain-containing protein [Reticulomyxa filosa]|eukprot:ETO08584.1 SNF2-related domain-containing protein [Reticulomyxa filosa]